MRLILWVITFMMLFASMSRASGAPVFEVEAICRTAIASIMGRDPKMMQVTLATGERPLLTYVRPIDNFVWNYRCRIQRQSRPVGQRARTLARRSERRKSLLRGYRRWQATPHY